MNAFEYHMLCYFNIYQFMQILRIADSIRLGSSKGHTLSLKSFLRRVLGDFWHRGSSQSTCTSGIS